MRERQNFGWAGTRPREEQHNQGLAAGVRSEHRDVTEHGDKPFGSCNAPHSQPVPPSPTASRCSSVGSHPQAWKEGQLHIPSKPFQEPYQMRERIFVAAFFPQPFLLSYFCLTSFSPTPLLWLIKARNFFIKSLYSAITTFTIHEVAPPSFLSLSMCLEAYFCSAHFTESLSSFQTQTKKKEEKVGGGWGGDNIQIL